jgi:hypothetical protein
MSSGSFVRTESVFTSEPPMSLGPLLVVVGVVVGVGVVGVGVVVGVVVVVVVVGVGVVVGVVVGVGVGVGVVGVVASPRPDFTAVPSARTGSGV